MGTKPNRSKEISQEELDILETSEYLEIVDGYKSDDLQYFLPL